MLNDTVREGANRPSVDVKRRYIRNGGVAAIVVALVTTLMAWRGGEAAAQREAVRQEPATANVAAQAPRVVDAAGLRTSYADVVDKVAPAVVTVRVEGRLTPTPTSGQVPEMDEFRRFFGPQFRSPQPRGRMRGLGSGVVTSQDGYILTNNHVVDGADEIRVEMQDRRVLEAKLIGSDPATDLAVIKIEGKALPTVTLGNSDRVRAGDVVLAFGNPLNVGQTVTTGIVSAKGRTTGLGDGSFEDFLQTDAPINHGNSGGALVNASGELVGITSQILSPSGGNVGLGFAIPVNMARNVMDQLIKDGRVQRAKLGVTVQGVTSDLAKSLGLSDVRGGLVSQVESGSAAAHAGIRQGDVILEVNGRPIADSNELRNTIASTRPGTTVTLKIVRDGRPETVRATLSELQGPKQASRGSGLQQGDPGYGMAVQPLTPDLAQRFDLPGERGLVVSDVDPDGEAAASGIQLGDVIRKVNGREVASTSELRDALAKATDKPALLLVARGDQTMFLTLRPDA